MERGGGTFRTAYLESQENCTIHPIFGDVYMDSFFTADGKASSALNKHVKDKRKHLLKWVAFCPKIQTYQSNLQC